MTSLEAFSLKVLGSEAPSSTIGLICLPSTPPAALTSEIAMRVASDRDFSMIDSPPVSENSTPTLMVSAAFAVRLTIAGAASVAAPSAAEVRSLRRSIFIPILPTRSIPVKSRRMLSLRRMLRQAPHGGVANLFRHARHPCRAR